MVVIVHDQYTIQLTNATGVSITLQHATRYTDMREVDVLEASHRMCVLDVTYISSTYTNTLVGVHDTNYLNANLKPHDLQYLNPQMTLSKLSKLSKMILDYIIYYAGSVIIYL